MGHLVKIKLTSNSLLPELTLAGAVECTDCVCRGIRLPPMSALDMTLNNLMVRLQLCWSFGEYGVYFHCHHSQAVVAPDKVLSMGQIEIFDI